MFLSLLTYDLQDSWYVSIYEKFRNERRQSNDPEVVLHAKRSKNEDEKVVIKKLSRGGINWVPPYPEGEDEMSMKRHKEFICNE